MPGSPPRPIGRPHAVLHGRNLPGGWMGYRLVRDLTVKRPPPLLHGNHRHGERSKAGIASRRRLRVAIRMLREGLWWMPMPATGPPAPGWRAFRDRQAGVVGAGPRPLSYVLAVAYGATAQEAEAAGTAEAQPTVGRMSRERWPSRETGTP